MGPGPVPVLADEHATVQSIALLPRDNGIAGSTHRLSSVREKCVPADPRRETSANEKNLKMSFSR